jgi:hypothetical protein
VSTSFSDTSNSITPYKSNMSEGNQITPVDEIAHDDEKLVKKAEELVRILPYL